MNLEHYLGQFETRYFGLGHKQTDYLFIMIGSDVFNTIKFSAKLAHQISEEMTND